MSNEIILILSLLFIFGSVLLWYRLFGKTGLYCYMAVTTIMANIEVLLLVEAFGVQQTLGNVLFASTFLATDMLSEFEGKEAANKATNIGIASALFFVILSQMWLLYTPAAEDWAGESFHVIFAMAPRITISSLAVYAIVQKLDVWLYHKWWAFTKEKFGDGRRFLWLRNNFSTLTSQLINTILYNLLAFWGVYSGRVMLDIIAAGYVIFIFTSLIDTVFLYLARRIIDKEQVKS